MSTIKLKKIFLNKKTQANNDSDSLSLGVIYLIDSYFIEDRNSSP